MRNRWWNATLIHLVSGPKRMECQAIWMESGRPRERHRARPSLRHYRCPILGSMRSKCIQRFIPIYYYYNFFFLKIHFHFLLLLLLLLLSGKSFDLKLIRILKMLGFFFYLSVRSLGGGSVGGITCSICWDEWLIQPNAALNWSAADIGFKRINHRFVCCFSFLFDYQRS